MQCPYHHTLNIVTDTIAASDVPMTEYSIDHLNFYDIPMDESRQKAVAANVSITAYNEFPVSGTVPVLAF